MSTICMCICINYDTKHSRIIPFVDLSMAREPYFVDNFALSESNPFWVSSIFHCKKSKYGDISTIVLPNLFANLRGTAY